MGENWESSFRLIDRRNSQGEMGAKSAGRLFFAAATVRLFASCPQLGFVGTAGPQVLLFGAKRGICLC